MLVTTLEDGSVVYLAQESTLQYPEHFTTDKREVNLQGEAFFDVAKNHEQTFLIETGKVRLSMYAVIRMIFSGYPCSGAG